MNNRTIEAVEQRRATIYRLHDEGRRPVEIARLAGCSLSTVCRALASPSAEDRRRLNGRRRPDRLAGEGSGGAAVGREGDPYAGVGVEDYGVVAAADPDSLVPEVTLLRAYIRATARQVVAATGDERRQAQLMLRTNEMIHALVRVFRAVQRGEVRREDLRDQVVGEAAEWVRGQAEGQAARVASDAR